ncbi:MAG: DNA primase [Candidatus Omnitrophica bacterium]|nr:DNA primase [Candidatus Omnitrophota bacterium]
MKKFSEALIREVQERCDIVELVSRYVPLKRAGKNLKACCPFHHEKTPSFIVSPDKQIFHCFGCGAGGDVFAFLMKQERMEFPEAVRALAERAGMQLPSDGPPGLQAESPTVHLYRINELACRYFQQMLFAPEAAAARAYLQQRRISEPTRQRFRIGYAPERWQGVIDYLSGQGVPPDETVAAGLAVRSEQGRMYDRFRGRVIFPISNIQGKISGFGGRIVAERTGDQQTAKYINSPETAVYHKSKNLFGLYHARQEIQRLDGVLIVEGYFDCIIPAQFGIGNVVASLGTALTVDHARLLRRYSRNVTVVFDADAAGENAVLRGADILMAEGLQVRVARLPAGCDPDTAVLREGPERFKTIVQSAVSLFDFSWQMACARHDKKTPEGKARIAADILQLIGKIKDVLLRTAYVKQLAELLDMPERVLRQHAALGECAVALPPRAAATACCAAEQRSPVLVSAERLLLAMLFDESQYLADLKAALSPAEFTDPQVRAAVEELLGEFERSGRSVRPADLLHRLNDRQAAALVCDLIARDFGIQDHRKTFEDCVRKIKTDAIKKQIRQLQQQMSATVALDAGAQKQLLQEILCLKKEQKKYEKSGCGEKEKEDGIPETGAIAADIPG